jgi:hypothetical protein
MKEAYYFSHDANARHDPKAMALKIKHGLAGYGIYWSIVEMLREADDYRLPMKAYMWASIAMDTMMTPEDAEAFVRDCISDEIGLFSSDGEYFWSNSLIRRMNMKKEAREAAREAGKRGAAKRWPPYSDPIATLWPPYSDPIATPWPPYSDPNGTPIGSDSKERKGKESKGKEKKECGEGVCLSDEEYEKLVTTYGSTQTKKLIDKLSNYKVANGKKYKSDYRAILNWVVEATKVTPLTTSERCPHCNQTLTGTICKNPECPQYAH